MIPVVPDCLIPNQIRRNARSGVPVIGPEGLCAGRSVAICGAGPSLVQPDGYDEVWACNRAVYHVTSTHGVCIDPSREMCRVWRAAPDLAYFLGSAVSPHLVAQLRPHRMAFFHSLQTQDNDEETRLYGELFARTALAHTGMNVASRAVDLALWLGYSTVDLYGCDMAFGANREMYADGARYDGGWWLETELGGRLWRTKGDMLATAVALVRLRRERPELRFIGDTLLRALQHQPDDILDHEWQKREYAACSSFIIADPS